MTKKKFTPKNKLISDIYLRINASLPATGMEYLRTGFAGEWKVLEKRIEEYYIEKKKMGK